MARICESVYIGGTKAGVIIRRIDSGMLWTHTVFRLPGSMVFDARNCIAGIRPAGDWTGYSHREELAGTRITVRRRDGTLSWIHAAAAGVDPTGSMAPDWDGPGVLELVGQLPAGTVPGSAEYLLLVQLLGMGQPRPDARRPDVHRLDFHRLDDAEPWRPPVSAALVAAGTEIITVPRAETVDCLRIDLVVGGVVTRRHWVRGMDVIKTAGVESGRQGAESYLSRDMDILLAGLAPDVVARLRAAGSLT